MSVSTASSEAQARLRDGGVAGLDSSRLVESDIASAAARVRGAEDINPGADRMADAKRSPQSRVRRGIPSRSSKTRSTRC